MEILADLAAVDGAMAAAALVARELRGRATAAAKGMMEVVTMAAVAAARLHLGLTQEQMLVTGVPALRHQYLVLL